MKKLLAVLGIMFAVVASATPPDRSTLSWTDPNGDVVGPFAVLHVSSNPSTALLYVDQSTGYVWTIQDPRAATPGLIGVTGVGLGLIYTTTDCTGAAYISLPDVQPVPKTVVVSPADGLAYVEGAIASVTTRSRFVNGTCYLDASAYSPLYVAVGPLTPPTVPAGPWHLTVR
jgi:hypothetical protein